MFSDSQILPTSNIFPFDRWLHFRSNFIFLFFFLVFIILHSADCPADSNNWVSLGYFCKYVPSQFYAASTLCETTQRYLQSERWLHHSTFIIHVKLHFIIAHIRSDNCLSALMFWQHNPRFNHIIRWEKGKNKNLKLHKQICRLTC